MGIVAGLLVQNTLKYLLQFGKVTTYLGYNALDDFFPTYPMKPNPDCSDSFCRRRQQEVSQRRAAEAANSTDSVTQQEADVVTVTHTDNDWGICVVEESVKEETSRLVAPGLKLAYDAVRSSSAPAESDQPEVDENTNEDIDFLMAKMKEL